MRKILFILALALTSNAYACEWRLTVEDLHTNELKYYRSSSEINSFPLEDPTSDIPMYCSHLVKEIELDKEDKKHFRSIKSPTIICQNKDGLIHRSKGARIESIDGNAIVDNYPIHEIHSVSLDGYKEFYRLSLRCE